MNPLSNNGSQRTLVHCREEVIDTGENSCLVVRVLEPWVLQNGSVHGCVDSDTATRRDTG